MCAQWSATPSFIFVCLDIAGEWLQVDFLVPTYVTGVITQGRGLEMHKTQMVSSFKIQYGNSTTDLQYIMNCFGIDTVSEINLPFSIL